MTDGTPSRIAQLRSRWEADPTSRIFLQLAEEYRHQGRVKEALEVLEKGLKEHPGYLSALVAKGRCYLEMGEPQLARAVLERVVKQDATQMVANKLLVRAYLETGEPDRARERLDLYSLLNDGDPEIEELRRRIKTAERATQAASPAEAGSSAGRQETLRHQDSRAAGDVFDLDLVSPAPPAAVLRVVEDVFQLGDYPAVPPAEPAEPPLQPLAAVPTSAEPYAVAEDEEEPVDGDLFPGLASRASRQRYLSALAAEGIFLLDLSAPAAAPRPPEPARRAPETQPVELAPASPAEETPAALAPAAPALAPPLPVDAEPAVPATRQAGPAAPAPSPAEPAVSAPPAATVTLGDLYLRQGHLQEAARIFRQVLEREPDNAAAREGLEHASSLAREPRPLDAGQLLAGFAPDLASGGPNARKVFVLSRYLERLRRGSQRHVS